MDKKELDKEYEDLVRFIQYSLQNLPECVFYGLKCADADECGELMKDFHRLERISERLGIDNSAYLEFCRWHYENYPVFLNKKDDYKSYEEYISKHNGPLNVEL